MVKLITMADVENLTDEHSEFVKATAEGVLTTLDLAYGDDRTEESEMGGIVFVIETQGDIDELMADGILTKGIITEFVDFIGGEDEIVHAMALRDNDFSYSFITTKEIARKCGLWED